MVVWEETTIKSTKAQSIVNRLKPNVGIYVSDNVIEYLARNNSMSDDLYYRLVRAYNNQTKLSGEDITAIKQVDNTIIEANGVFTFCRCSTPLTTVIGNVRKEVRKKI